MLSARTLTTTAALLLAGTVWVTTTDTLGGFSAARVTNGTNTTASGQLSVTDTYSTTCTATPVLPAVTTACAGSILPVTTPSTGTATASTSIQNSGTFAAASITARYRVGACGVLQFANPITAGRPMLPRTGTTFAPTSGPMTGSGSVAFDGTSGYAASTTATTEPNGSGLLSQATYGLGIWFKTTATTVSPLFGFGSSALATTASNDRILYLDATGRIGFVATTSGTSTTAATASGVTKYNDGSWHFAWVQSTVTSVLSYSVTVSVDGKTVNTTSGGVLGSLTNYSGYWHLGWSPVGGTARFFNGSLSDFVVDDSGSAPAAGTSTPTSYTSFDTTRTDQWYLNDSGGTFDGSTLGGTISTSVTLPSSSADPCTYVDIGWAMTGPTATALTRQSLRAAATASWQTLSANPGPSVTQTAVVTLQRDTTFNAYAVGLLLYVPMETDYAVGSSAWKITFRWSGAAAGAAAGSTVVVG